jgi:hypothetical protein
MRVSEVKFQIERIKEMQGRDDEKAHNMEDELHLSVLSAIASGSKLAQKLAQEALKSSKLSFKRWGA